MHGHVSFVGNFPSLAFIFNQRAVFVSLEGMNQWNNDEKQIVAGTHLGLLGLWTQS